MNRRTLLLGAALAPLAASTHAFGQAGWPDRVLRIVVPFVPGSFTDISARSGLAAEGWSVSAAFVDIDRDGWLDLFVGHYLTWNPALNTPCYGTSGRRVYCAPQVYRAQQSRLYRNNRDGTFVDVTNAAGLATQFGPALGVEQRTRFGRELRHGSRFLPRRDARASA